MADQPKFTWRALLRAWFAPTVFALGTISAALALISFFTLNPVIENVDLRKQNLALALAQYEEALAIVNRRQKEIESGLNLDELPADQRQTLLKTVTPAITQAATPFATIPSINLVKEVDKQVAALAQRVEQIESRFPSETIIDKVASVNEALLALHVDVINRRLDKIEADRLTEGNVFTIVIGVLAALGALAAIGALVIAIVRKSSPRGSSSGD